MTYRSREQSVGFMIICALASLFWVASAYKALVRYNSVAEAVLEIIIGAAFAVVLIRASRACAEVDGSRLIVKNTFRTTSIDADDIVEFRLGPRRSTVFYGAAAVERRNGGELIIFGIQTPNTAVRPNAGDAQKLVDQLNEWLCRTRNVDPSRHDRAGFGESSD